MHQSKVKLEIFGTGKEIFDNKDAIDVLKSGGVKGSKLTSFIGISTLSTHLAGAGL